MKKLSKKQKKEREDESESWWALKQHKYMSRK